MELKKGDLSSIHSFYQELYLTDLKNDIGELDTDLQQEKGRNMKLNQQLNKLKEELATAKRTIANYRKMVTDMQKDFFKSSKQTAPSTNSGFTGVKLGARDNSSVSDHADDDSIKSLV